jgi:hypothetical protein
MANNEALREVMIHVTYEPKRLDMGNWASTDRDSPCGTTACVAGWAVILRGKLPVVISLGAMHLPYGHEAEEVGRELLGLTEEEARLLFHTWNENVWTAVEEITEGAVNRAEVEAYCAAHPLPEQKLHALPPSVIEPKNLTERQRRVFEDELIDGWELAKSVPAQTITDLYKLGLVAQNSDDQDCHVLTDLGVGMYERITEMDSWTE